MKKLFFVLLMTAVAMTSCMKDYGDDEVIPNNNGNKAPTLKVTGANSSSGDTTFAEPNVYLKFWLDELPLAASDYTYVWNLGNGNTSTAESPEQKYQNGTYAISVTITPIAAGGNTIYREITLVVRPGAGNRTILLYSATPVSGGNYNYTIAMKTTAIYNYANISGDPWTLGDWTEWEVRYISETTMINGVLYIIDHVTLPANNQEVQRFTYGKGNTYSYDPNSPYWVVTGQNEGVYEVYLTNGQMSPDPISYIAVPGNSGDISNGTIAPTVRNEIKYSGIPNNDSLKIYINYAQYGNGSQPFISRMLADNNWQNIPLVQMSDEFTGWGYQMFRISDLNAGLYFRFGPNINSPENYGIMNNSMYFLPDGNMLGLQIASVYSSSGVKYEITPLITEE